MLSLLSEIRLREFFSHRDIVAYTPEDVRESGWCWKAKPSQREFEDVYAMLKIVRNIIKSKNDTRAAASMMRFAFETNRHFIAEAVDDILSRSAGFVASLIRAEFVDEIHMLKSKFTVIRTIKEESPRVKSRRRSSLSPTATITSKSSTEASHSPRALTPVRPPSRKPMPEISPPLLPQQQPMPIDSSRSGPANVRLFARQWLAFGECDAATLKPHPPATANRSFRR